MRGSLRGSHARIRTSIQLSPEFSIWDEQWVAVYTSRHLSMAHSHSLTTFLRYQYFIMNNEIQFGTEILTSAGIANERPGSNR